MERKEDINRREFIQLSAFAAGVVAVPFLSKFQNQLLQKKGFRLIPAEKDYSQESIQQLIFDPSIRILTGGQLKFVGMPIGGICAGQVNLGGDGQLWLWDIFNQIKFGVVDKSVTFRGKNLSAGDGANYVDPPEQVHPFDQGFSLQVKSSAGNQTRRFNYSDWADIQFCGEYPVGFVTYRDPTCPVVAKLTSYSPFIPLDEAKSSMPCVIMKFDLTNSGEEELEIHLEGWLENPIGKWTNYEDNVFKTSKVTEKSNCVVMEHSVISVSQASARPPILFEDFEKPNYANWTVEGNAFGPGPIEISKMPKYQGIVGGIGKRIACSHNARNGATIEQADAMVGKLTSTPFIISRKFISFMIAGGNHPGQTCISLVIDGKIVRSATGSDSNTLHDAFFDVSESQGQKAQIEMLDNATGGWGNISIDQIIFTDTWPDQSVLNRRTDVGTMAISLLNSGEHTHRFEVKNVGNRQGSSNDGSSHGENEIRAKYLDKAVGYLGKSIRLLPGEKASVLFSLAWSLPNLELPLLGKVGHLPSTRYSDLTKLNEMLAKSEAYYDLTMLWHDTWYDSTLPRWFLDRTMGNTSTLATMTSTLFNSGRFYGWEGIGCCEGTCGHVYQYAQAMARLFPELERSVREMVDFGVAFHPDSGIIEFRGEYGDGYAVDSQAGYILRAYREHQMSKDSKFLTRLWSRIKLALNYLMLQDGNGDGLIENAQHNTLDVDLFGPSSWLSSLYLAALSAGKAMALELGDVEFANKCDSILKIGYDNFSNRLWNGNYFIQIPAPNHPDALQYGDGCEVDQVMGEAWCWQLGLQEGGKTRLFDPAKTNQALTNLYKNNFLPNVGPYRDKHPEGRWYALPGEGGLVMCTFPKGDRNDILGNTPTWASMYFNECMTGFEYEAASHMIAEGLVHEGLTIIKTVHDRYDPLRHNPWNEVECSDHYARCMAVYGAFIAICGFEHHGPLGHIGFAPRITPENFKSAFTSCAGWGTYRQQINDSNGVAILALKYGELKLKTLALQVETKSNLSHLKAILSGSDLPLSYLLEGTRLLITLKKECRIARDQELRISWG